MALTQEQTQQLARIQGYGTTYEIVLIGPDKRYLVGYAPAGRAALIRAVYRVGGDIGELTGEESFVTGKKASDGVTLGTDWKIVFSGRTYREAIIAGELPFVPDAAEAKREEAQDMRLFDDGKEGEPEDDAA